MSFPKIFRHGVVDGWIRIDNATGTESIYPYSWWITQEPAYIYPSGASYVQYTEGGVPGQSYYIKDDNQYGLPQDPWLEGNAYIAKQSIYDAAYAIFIGTPTTAAEAKALKFNSLLAQLQIIRSGGVIYGANTFPSSVVEYQSRFSELDRAIRAAALPVGYYVKDVLAAHVSLNLADLTLLVDGIEELHYEARLVNDTHNEAINAFGNTVGDITTIMAYDVTTGWPTVPFTI